MNIKNFDLNLLRSFDALMRERNVSRAAERMCLSQPAMSNALNRLRDLLDDPLLVRTSRGMQPTPKALAIEESIHSALMSIELSIGSETAFAPHTSQQVFHVATTDYVELAFLPGLIVHLNKVAPAIQLEVHSLGPDVPELELEEGIYDFAIGRYIEVPSRLSSEFWRSEQLVCLVRDKHPIIEEQISIEQFMSIKQIWVNGGQRTGVVDQWLKEHQLSRNVVHTTPSFLVAPNLVSQSDMLVVTPMAIAQHYVTYLPLKIVPLPMPLDSLDLKILWHPYHAGTPAHHWFREQLRLFNQSA